MIEPKSLTSSALAGRFFSTEPPGKQINIVLYIKQTTNKDLLYSAGNTT